MRLSRLRIVVFPDSPKTWTARSLEHDISVAGRTADAAIDSLVKVAEAHIAFDTRHGRRPLSGFSSAPEAYWSAFAKAGKPPRELMRTDATGVLQFLVNQLPENPAITRRPRPVRIA